MTEEQARRYLMSRMASPDEETAGNMVSLARYVSDRGHRSPVCTSGVDGKAVGIVYDGVGYVQ